MITKNYILYFESYKISRMRKSINTERLVVALDLGYRCLGKWEMTVNGHEASFGVRNVLKLIMVIVT